MLSIEAVIATVIYLIVGGLILWLLMFLIDYCGLPEPFAKVARVILMVVAVLIIISALLSFIGHPIVRF